jgi:hypothetical protein
MDGSPAPTDWLGRPCPKCSYVRAPADSNPAWQCPRCHVAYAKVGPAAALGTLVRHGGEMAKEARSDFSLASLIAANVFAIAVAWHSRMSLQELMLVYWIQSVIIGVSNIIRILNLDRFMTEGFTMNNAPVRPDDPAAKQSVAIFFAVHYGLFHAIYLVFILVSAVKGQLGASPLPYVLCALGFALNHAYSLRHNIARDAAGRPNIGTLMFLPYARIVPMHMTIVTGGLVAGSAFGFFLFCGLKTFADAVMHTVEHHMLAESKR